MSVLNFVKAMLPRVQKSTVEEDIRATLKELDNITLPRYKLTGEYLRVNKIKDESTLRMTQQFYSDMQLKYHGPNIISDIGSAMDRIRLNLIHVQSLVDSVLEADILNEGLTVKKAHLVRAAGSMSFISSFGIDFLDFVMQREAIKAGADEPMDNYREKYIEGRYRRFFQSLSDYSMDPEKFKKVMLDVPDVVITSKNAASLNSIFEPKKLDPFKSTGLTGFTGNPIYHVRLVIASWQESRYQADRDKLKLLELRLLQLQDLKEGKPNPQLEQEIDYLKKRISKIEKSMREVEEDIGLK